MLLQSMIRTLACAALLMPAALTAQSGPRPQLLGGRSLLHAHNAYEEEGQYGDRINRAIATGLSPIVIEQDIAFAAGRGGQSVVSHDTTLDGTEPTLEAHFFTRVRPIVEHALKAGDRSRWPLIVLHLDFKTNEREHHRAVWDLLATHRAWLTTAPSGSDSSSVSPLTPGPVIVLTENGENQERDFTEWAAATGTHLLFGSIPGPAFGLPKDDVERARILVRASPQTLIPAPATTYRRWVNFAWAVIEEGGPTRAGAWTPEDEARLLAVVRYAHAQGLLVRFYTLNGHAAEASRGWSASYNFGTMAAVRQRWQAAIGAGVDLIATDQYEEFAALLR